MAKITAVIDIGSNSARMVVFERTSRYGFHLLHEIKSKVRISQGAYDNGGFLQEESMQRALSALADFKSIALSYRATKILTVATSAVRDAPNKNIFLSRVKKELDLSIRVIEGERESYLGGIAALNLLPITDAITVDIGGGSTELALIKDSKILSTVSLPLGTVRLKELFFDKKSSLKEITQIIKERLSSLPKEFQANTLVAIGGTNRAIATAIMHLNKHPIDSVHGFSCTTKEVTKLTEKILETTSKEELRKYKIKEERFDVIKEGTLIIKTILETLKPTTFMASGAGVREGVYLVDILGENARFPKGVNPSVQTLCDRFIPHQHQEVKELCETSLKLFDLLKPLHKLDNSYRHHLFVAAKLSLVGKYLNFYNTSSHSFYMILSALSYGFTHTERMIIANIVRNMQTKGEKSPFSKKIREFPLHPVTSIWLESLFSLAKAIHTVPIQKEKPLLNLEKGGKLILSGVHFQTKLSREALDKVPLPLGISLHIRP